MKKPTLLALALVTAAITHTSSAAQDNNALLDLLVKKKVISASEADKVSAELEKDAEQSSADKLKLSSSVTELKLSGDLRLRYQYDNRDSQVDPAGTGGDEDRSPSGTQRSRYRFRLRLNADFKLGENWFGGVQLQTSQNADSGNQTFDNGFNNYDIFISRAFVGWKNDWLTIVGGKLPNPLYTTDLVWDADINPQGLTEAIRFHEMHFGGGSEPDGGYGKDGKSVVKSDEKTASPWELTLNLGQFIYDDNADSSFDNDASDDAYLFVAQLVGSYRVSKGVKVTLAPGAMFFNAADLSGFQNENAFGAGDGVEGVSGESRKLTVLTAPGDVSFKVAGIPTKLYWDFAYNTQGQGRFDDIYAIGDSLHDTEDDIAWLAGVQLGELKKAGQVQVNLNWRQSGISSIDPNLNDSDFALGELNTRGPKASLFYAFTDFFNAGVSYMQAWNLKDNLPPGVGGIGDANGVQVLQVDMNLKF